jgi:hypothetical protein
VVDRKYELRMVVERGGKEKFRVVNLKWFMGVS